MLQMWEAILIELAKSAEREGYKEATQYLMQCRLVCQTWCVLINGILSSQSQDWNLMFARKPKEAVKKLTQGWHAIGSTKLQGVGDLVKWTRDLETSFVEQPARNPFPDNCLILNCAGTTADGIVRQEKDKKRLSECLSGIAVWGHHLSKFVYIACDEMAETRRNVRAILNYLPNLEIFTVYTYTWWKCSKKLREIPQGHNGSSVTDWLRVAGIAAQTLKCHHENSRSPENCENDETETPQLKMKAVKICDISQQILYTLELGAKRYQWPLQTLSLKFISVEGIKGISWNKFVHILYHFCDTLEHLRLEVTSQDFLNLNYETSDDEYDNQTVSHFTFPKLKLLAVSYAFCCLTSKYPMRVLITKCDHLQKLQFLHSTVFDNQLCLDLPIKSWLQQEGLCSEIEISHVSSDTF